MITSDVLSLKKEICYFLKIPFECNAWIQNMIAYDESINQLHKLWTEKLKWKEKKKNTAQGDIIITPESEGMPTIGSSTVTIKSSNNRQQKFTKPDTS